MPTGLFPVRIKGRRHKRFTVSKPGVTVVTGCRFRSSRLQMTLCLTGPLHRVRDSHGEPGVGPSGAWPRMSAGQTPPPLSGYDLDSIFGNPVELAKTSFAWGQKVGGHACPPRGASDPSVRGDGLRSSAPSQHELETGAAV